MTVSSLVDEPGTPKCIKCGTDITPTAKFCLKCGAAQASQHFEATPVHEARAEAPVSPAIPRSPKPPQNPESYSNPYSSYFPKLRVRYQDAYAVAGTLVTTGKIIKIAGLVIGVLLLFIGIIFLAIGLDANVSESMPLMIENFVVPFFLGLPIAFLGVITAGGGFISGRLMTAVGHSMITGIDTAVNTSENISPDEKAEILGLC